MSVARQQHGASDGTATVRYHGQAGLAAHLARAAVAAQLLDRFHDMNQAVQASTG